MGHPDHELLFVAKQVQLAAGLLDKQWVTLVARDNPNGALRYNELATHTLGNKVCLTDSKSRRLRPDAWLMDEPTVYKMLLRGHAPQSEPFRKWVTEEVLPSIRKTGSYDIAKSETPEGIHFAEEFGKLRAEIGMLASEDVLNNLMDTVCVCETT